MKDETSILWNTAQSLELRLSTLQVPRYKVAIEEWNEYENILQCTVPNWYKQLLSEFSFMGVHLELPNYEGESWASNFCFRSPIDLIDEHSEDTDVLELGWFPFAEESDGNLWAIKLHSDCNSPVILVDHSAGGFDTEEGIKYAAHSLAHILSAAAISNARYEELTDDDFVDISKSGYKIWGDSDKYTESQGFESPQELKNSVITPN